MRPAGPAGFLFAWRGWILAALLAALAFARARSHASLQPGWLGLLAAGLAWRAWAGFHIEGHSNGAAFSGPSLAGGGPYRISRHPLYFANLLGAAGIVLYAHCLPAWAALSALALAVAHHEALARAEERFLLSRHGARYRGYMQVTPRWPALRWRGIPGWAETEALEAGAAAVRPRSARADGTGAAEAGPAGTVSGEAGAGEAIARTGMGRAGADPMGGWRSVWRRQGWNLAKGCACALAIRIAAAAAG